MPVSTGDVHALITFVLMGAGHTTHCFGTGLHCGETRDKLEQPLAPALAIELQVLDFGYEDIREVQDGFMRLPEDIYSGSAFSRRQAPSRAKRGRLSPAAWFHRLRSNTDRLGEASPQESGQRALRNFQSMCSCREDSVTKRRISLRACAHFEFGLVI